MSMSAKAQNAALKLDARGVARAEEPAAVAAAKASPANPFVPGAPRKSPYDVPGPKAWEPRTVAGARYRVTRVLKFTAAEWAWCQHEAARIHGQPERETYDPRNGRPVVIPARVAEARRVGETLCAVFVNRVADSVDTEAAAESEGEEEA